MFQPIRRCIEDNDANLGFRQILLKPQALIGR